MSRLFQSLRRGALACALVGAAAGVAAGPASAASLSNAAKCKFPLTGTVPATLSVSGALPTEIPEGVPTGAIPLDVNLAFPDTRGQGQGLSPGFSLSGVINLRLAVKNPSGFSQTVPVQVPISPVTVPANSSTGYLPFDVAGTGTLPSLSFDEQGETSLDVVSFIPNLTFSIDGEAPGSVGTPPTGIDREPFIDSDGDPATADIPCRFEPKVDAVNLAKIDVAPLACLPVILPPETPTAVPFQSGDVGPTSVRLRWGKPEVPRCGTSTAKFRVTGAGKTVEVPATQTDTLVEGLQPNTGYSFQVVALDESGFASQPLTISVRTAGVVCTDDLKPPPTPVALPLGNADIGATTVTLRWQPGEEGLCPTENLTSYSITYGTKTVTVPGTQNTLLVTGLTPSTAYAFEIRSVAATVSYSRAPLVVNVTTDPSVIVTPISYDYDLAGSTTLKTLTKGTLQLRGQIKAQLTLATGAVSADLILNDTSGRLVAAGFLPVTAKVGFAPSGKTTGSLVDGVLKTNSKVRIKVKEIKLFGAIPLAGGNNCQTKNLSDINLQSTQAEFLPLTGGPLAGSYKISDLNGCGALNGLVSPLTAGGGNTIALNLTPKGATF